LDVLAEKENLNSNLQSSLTQLQEEFQGLRERFQDVEHERDLINDHLETEMGANAEKESETEEKLQKIRDEVIQLRQELAELLENKDILTAEIISLRNTVMELDDLKAHFSAVESERDSFSLEVSAAKEFFVQLQSEHESERAMMANERDTLLMEISSVRERLSELQSENETTENSLDIKCKDLSQLQEIHENTLEKISEYMDKITGFTATEFEMQKQINELVCSKASLQTALQVAQSDRDKLQCAVQEKEGECETLMRENVRLSSASVQSMLLDEMEESEREAQRLVEREQERAIDQKIIQDLQEEKVLLEQEKGMLQAQINVAKEESVQFKANLCELIEATASSIDSSETMEGMVSLSRFNEIELTSESIATARKMFQRSHERIRNELGQREGELSCLLKEREELKERLRIAEDSLLLNHSMALQREDAESLSRKRLDQLQTETNLLKSERDSLSLQLKDIEVESRQNVNSLERECDQLTSSVETLSAKLLLLQEHERNLCCERDGERLRVESLTMQRDKALKDVENLTLTLEQEQKRQATLQIDSQEHSQLVIQIDMLKSELSEQFNRNKRNKDEQLVIQSELTAALQRIESLTDALEEAEKESSLEREQEEELKVLRTSMALLQQREQQHDELMEELKENLVCAEAELLHFQAEAEKALNELTEQGHQHQQEMASLQLLMKEQSADLLSKQSIEMNLEWTQKLELQQAEWSNSVSILKSRVEEISKELSNKEEEMRESERETSREREFVMQMADMQMESLRNEIQDIKDRENDKIQEIEHLHENEKQLLIKAEKLQRLLSEKEDLLTQVENDLFELQTTGVPQQAMMERERELEKSLKDLQSRVNVLESEIEGKDARIVHLDACKLTKDQMERIKVIKEERKKFQEDAKTLKKQLVNLKGAYDELKSSMSEKVAASTAGKPSQEFVISDLKFQLAEATSKLQSSQSVVELLKDKLKDCSSQLEEYEHERSAVLTVLEQHGVDISGLLPLDTSSFNSSLQSESNNVAGHDLSDAVAKLAERLVGLQSALSLREKDKHSATLELEEKLRAAQTEGESWKAQKLVYEKKIESLKAAARTSREETAQMSAEIDSLQEKVSTLQQELHQAEKKVVSSSDIISSEVQVLEEENIELMDEIKELKKELAIAKRASAVVSLHKPSAVSVTNSNSNDNDSFAPTPTKSPTPNPTSAIKKQRAFGNDIDPNSSSTTTMSSSLPTTSAVAVAAAVTKSSSAAKRPIALVSEQDSENVAPQQGKTRRVRAKAVTAVGADNEQTGECKQS
jgi:chromosome segregation ATPase